MPLNLTCVKAIVAILGDGSTLLACFVLGRNLRLLEGVIFRTNQLLGLLVSLLALAGRDHGMTAGPGRAVSRLPHFTCLSTTIGNSLAFSGACFLEENFLSEVGDARADL